MFVKRITAGSLWRIHISVPQFRVTRDQSMYPAADRTCVLSVAKRSTVLSQHQSALSSSSSSTTSHIKNNLEKNSSANSCSKQRKNFVTIRTGTVSSAYPYWFKFGITMGSDKVCKAGFLFVKWKCLPLILYRSPISARSLGAENGIRVILRTVRAYKLPPPQQAPTLFVFAFSQVLL
jgi:hypothetical protein